MPARAEEWRPFRWLPLLVLLCLTIGSLRVEGRRWWCRCGTPSPWSSGIRSGHTSQHLADPYSFTHVLHGMIFYALLRPFAGRLGPGVRLTLAVAVEAFWEIVENSPGVIERYRQATIAMGYTGDSVTNSIGDIGSCMIGFWLAGKLPWRWSIAFFVAVEVSLLAMYRDNLGLSVLMLIHPFEAIKSWQMGQ
jgi:hypothetical protein